MGWTCFSKSLDATQLSTCLAQDTQLDANRRLNMDLSPLTLYYTCHTEEVIPYLQSLYLQKHFNRGKTQTLKWEGTVKSKRVSQI